MKRKQHATYVRYTLEPPIASWFSGKMGCIDLFISWKFRVNFPLNHDYGRKVNRYSESYFLWFYSNSYWGHMTSLKRIFMDGFWGLKQIHIQQMARWLKNVVKYDGSTRSMFVERKVTSGICQDVPQKINRYSYHWVESLHRAGKMLMLTKCVAGNWRNWKTLKLWMFMMYLVFSPSSYITHQCVQVP